MCLFCKPDNITTISNLSDLSNKNVSEEELKENRKTVQKGTNYGIYNTMFYQKNTERLRESLKRLGIRPLLSNERLNAIGDNIKVYHGREAVFSCSYSQELYGHFLDCGTNENLFLAIAALRDDTDHNQLFVNDKGDWGIYRGGSDGGLSGIDFYGMPNDLNVDNYHKATVEELIEHFK